jgi:hypothetical protein
MVATNFAGRLQSIDQMVCLSRFSTQSSGYKSQLLDPVLSQMNPLHVSKPCFSNIHLIYFWRTAKGYYHQISSSASLARLAGT